MSWIAINERPMSVRAMNVRAMDRKLERQYRLPSEE
jgi:hypothetical protein